MQFDTRAQKFALGGVHPSGVFMYFRPCPSNIMRIPTLLKQVLQQPPHVHVLLGPMHLYLSTHRLLSHLSLQETIDLVFEPCWNLAMNKTTITHFELLCFRVECIEIMLQSIEIEQRTTHKHPFTICQQLLMWLSAHVPLWIWCQAHPHKKNPPRCRLPCMTKAIGIHLLPDASGVIHNLDFNNLFGSKNHTISPFAHIISKALPRRCQIRELARFLLDYFSKHKLLCHLFDRMLLLTLLGLYPCNLLHHGKKRPKYVWNFERLQQLYACFLLSTDAHQYVSFQLMQQKKTSSEIQALYFYVIREFLLHVVRQMPALRLLLIQHSEWQQFEDNVHSHLAQARMDMQRTIAPSKHAMLYLSQLMKLLHVHVCKSRNKTICTRNFGLYDTLYQLQHTMTKELAKLTPTEYDVAKQTMQAALKANKMGYVGLLSRTCSSSSHPLDSTEETESRNILALLFRHTVVGNHKLMQNCIVKLRAADSVRLFRFFHEIYLAVSTLQTYVYMLPRHIWLQQTLVLTDVCHKQQLFKVPHELNAIVICSSCGEIRSSYNKLIQSKGKKHIPPTIGAVDAIVDDNAMCLYCSKSTNVKSNVIDVEVDPMDDVQLQQAEAMSSHNKKTHSITDLTTLYCHFVPLQHVQILGNIVYHKGSSFSLCVQCACIVELDNERSCHMLCTNCLLQRQQKNFVELLMPLKATQCCLCDAHSSFESLHSYNTLQFGNERLLMKRLICRNCKHTMTKMTPGTHTLFECKQHVQYVRCKKQIRQFGFKRKAF